MVERAKKIKIAVDLDGILIDKPPLIPKKLLERLFRGSGGDNLHYRFPTAELEQQIRKISHYYLFRPPIKKNIAFLKEVANDKKYELYVISGRYSFLEKETENWLKKRKVKNLFKKIYLNLNDEQPHLFKERILRILRPDIFIDDDDLIADFLVGKQPHVRIFCCYDRGERCRKAKFIRSLSEIADRKL